jgi:hypothetical protein
VNRPERSSRRWKFRFRFRRRFPTTETRPPSEPTVIKMFFRRKLQRRQLYKRFFCRKLQLEDFSDG